MGQYLQINGDYNIKTKVGGTITLDTGSELVNDELRYPGKVEVLGDLNVRGTTTTIASTDLELVDRILTLNKGETGPGVTLRYGGIEIDRGVLPDSTLAPRAAFVYDQNAALIIGSQEGAWTIALGSDTTSYSFEDSNLKLRRILTDPSTDNGNLTLIATGTGVVSVAGTTNYEDRVTAFGDDALTNKKYVDSAILNNPTFQIRSPGSATTVASASSCSIIGNELTISGDITGTWEVGTILSGPGIVFNTKIDLFLTGTGQAGTYRLNKNYTASLIDLALIGFKDGSDTRIIIADKQILDPAPGSIAFHNTETSYSTSAESAISVIIDGSLSTQFYATRIKLRDLIVKDNELSAEQDVDVFVNTSGTGSLRINKSLKIDNTVGNNPNPVNNSSIIYAKPKNVGNTGLYFVSNDTTSGTNEDELISKNRALVFSMLF